MNRLKVLLWVAGGLVVIALLVNFLDPQRSLSRLLTRKSRLQAQYVRHFGGVKPMEPVGSKDAKVKLQLIVQSMNPCHAQTIDSLTEIAQAAPQRIRLEFLDTSTQAGLQARQQADIQCELGLLINGQNTFSLERGGKTILCSFHGPLGVSMPPELLQMAVEQELEKQYGGELTQEERENLDAVWKALPQALQKNLVQKGPEVASEPASGETMETQSTERREEKSPSTSEKTEESESGTPTPSEPAPLGPDSEMERGE